MLRCADCKEHKPSTDFSPNKLNKSGRTSYCKPCHNARNRARYDYPKARDAHLRMKYGISSAIYDAMLAAQDGKCASCSDVPAPIYTKRHPESAIFHVDHDHATGKVRGLLCYGCNCAVGFLRDKPDRLRFLIGYLEANG